MTYNIGKESRGLTNREFLKNECVIDVREIECPENRKGVAQYHCIHENKDVANRGHGTRFAVYKYE